MQKVKGQFNNYVTMLVGLVFLVFGSFLLTHTFDAGDIKLWMPMFLVLIGIFMLPAANQEDDSNKATKAAVTSTMIALGLMFAGLMLLFRQLGIITVPVLQYALGAGFAVVGLYGVIMGIVRIMTTPAHPTPTSTTRT
jgi:hypothetical protein